MVVSSRSMLSSSVLLSFSISGCSMWVSAPDSQVIGISVETPPQRIDSELGSECSHAFSMVEPVSLMTLYRVEFSPGWVISCSTIRSTSTLLASY